MTRFSYAHDGGTSTAAVSLQRRSRRTLIVWCHTAALWRQIRRWKFARAYRHATQDGRVVAQAFLIPKAKARFARHALGVPVQVGTPTARPVASDEPHVGDDAHAGGTHA